MNKIDLKNNKCAFEYLSNKIANKTAVVGVIGLGYVGLPLAVEKAKAGFNVVGFDIQQAKVDMVNEGYNYIGDILGNELKELVDNEKLYATTDYSKLLHVDTVAVCVPTPLDIYKQPDMSYVISSTKELVKYLHKGMLIVLESTTYPGATEEVIKPILESTGLKCGEEFFLAYSPERVDPGNRTYKIKNTPKVVGGITQKCTEIASLLYESILENKVFKVSSPSVAEMEKVLENTFRYINIALINQIAILCNKMGISILEVIEAAKTKPYGFMAFYPGPGPGGHCIPIDPFYLSWKAKGCNFTTSLIDTASQINSFMPDYMVERIIKILNSQGKSLKNSNILLLGVAYKKDIDDYRESPVLRIIEILNEYHANVFVNDPYISSFKIGQKEYSTTELNKTLLNGMDLAVLTTDHTNYDYNFIIENSKAVFDTRCAIKDSKVDFDKVVIL